MRSSGAATSTLTVLVPVDLLRLGMLFILAVRTSVGTMVSGILFAVTSSNTKDGMAVTLSHLFFNGTTTMTVTKKSMDRRAIILVGLTRRRCQTAYQRQ